MTKKILFLLILLVTIAFSISADELMTNGDLESWDTDTSPTGWDIAQNITKETTTIHGGTYSAKQIAGTKKLTQNVTGIIAGEDYTISYWFLDNDPDARVRMWAYWLSGSSTNSDNSAELRPGTYSTDSADWQQVSHTITAPAGVDGLRFEVRAYNENSGGGTVYYDDFSVAGAGGGAPQVLNAEFSADVTSGSFPLTVTFTNETVGGVEPYTYSWDFNNDGTEDSTLENPSYTYTYADDFTVSLNILDSATSNDSETKYNYITTTTPVGDSYYDSITANGGEALISQLNTLISTNTNSSYNGARAEMYAYIDNHNNTVSCVYTGDVVNHSYGTYSAPDGINCEHSYPQSWIEDYAQAGEISIAKADVHHLFPTLSGVNSSRGNLSFDVVSSIDYTYSEVAGYTSYRGDNADGITVFEPADQHKGDVARAMLYMAVRYGMPISNGARDLDVNMLPALLAWNSADPVDQDEIDRNNEIQAYQDNRNPFVDHNEWVNAIWGGEPVLTAEAPLLSPAGGTFDSVQNVTMTTNTDGASIYYTLDGSTPDATSTLYTTAVQVTEDVTIKAVSVKADYNNSPLAIETYNINIIPAVSIYDIQYSTEGASTYAGQTVNVTGIVSAVGTSGYNVSTANGGAWNGIHVNDSINTPSLGDEVTFNALVEESYLLTKLTSVNSFSLLSSGNSVAVTTITTAQLASEESFEGVLVKVENVTVTSEPSNYGEWYVTDGSGEGQIDDNYYVADPAPFVGAIYTSITGIIDYGYGNFGLNPRDAADVVLDASANQLPLITNVSHSPAMIYQDDAITFSADVVDNDGTITAVNLKWGTESGVYTTVAMTETRANYSVTINAQAENTTVYYIIEATDDDPETASTSEATLTVSPDPVEGVATDLFFSEYIEGSSQNKSLEIYNGTGATVDLSIYSVKKGTNGADFSASETLTGTLLDNDVLVMSHGSSHADILAVTDITPGVVNHNGDDAYGLFKNDVLIDVIGLTTGTDPGSGWAVAGTSNATKDRTLVRKSAINAPTTSWAVSAGTNVGDSQWTVYSRDTFDYLGAHTFDGAGTVVETVATPTITPESGNFETSQEVTIECATDGATIYYTLDDTDPTELSTEYTAAFNVTETTTVKAFAIKADFTNSAVATATYTLQAVVQVVDTPVITPESGNFETSQEVTITCATDGATIYYTLDDTDPTELSTEYTVAFSVTETTIVKAFAVKVDYDNSTVASATFTLTTPSTPEGIFFSEYIEGGSNNKSVEIYNGTGANLDLAPYSVKLGSNGGNWGNNIDLTGILLDGDVFVISNSGSAQAILDVTDATSSVCYFNGDDALGLFNADALIDVIGTYGTDPGSSWDVAGTTGATANHTLVRKTTITEGTTDWATSAGTDEINSQWTVLGQDNFDNIGYWGEEAPAIVATPTITPESGNFEVSQEVTIECATDGATIYYTLDDSEPTELSTEYTAPFSVTETTTVKAVGIKTDFANSNIVTATYTLVVFEEVPALVITEIMYNPAGSLGNDDVYEYLELYNAEDTQVDLSGVTFAQGIDFTFEAGTTIEANEYIVMAVDSTAYQGNGYAVYQFSGALGNSGETIELATSQGQQIDIVNYDDGGDWASEADGSGPSLELITLDLDNSLATSWQAITINGTPGAVNGTVAPVETVATPVIDPNGGNFTTTQEVTITSTTADAIIYYTLDGTEPTDASLLYSAAFSITETITVKAFATKVDLNDSAVATATFTEGTITVPTGVFFSEYIEGGSNNKAVEIYNGTGAEIDLTPYSVKLGGNGGEWGNSCDMIGTLAAGDVFVIANSSSDEAILAVKDTVSSITYYNGDDAVGLFYSDVLIDVIGVYGTDPGSSWDVAGTTGATANHTLVRKLTVTDGNTDWAISAGTDVNDSEWVVYDQDTFSFIGSHTELLEIVETPQISPDGGNFEVAQTVTITSLTENAMIYYTLDGSEPTVASTLYSATFDISEDTTVKAIAMKANFNNSSIATAEFTFNAVVEVATLADLRASTIDGTIYRLTGEAVLTYQRTSRNQKYIQDNTAAILIDDNSGIITTTYNIYDGITGIEGTLNEYNGTLQFIPTSDTGAATSTNNSVTAVAVTIDELNTNFNDYESELVVISAVTFVEAGDFASGSNYTLTDGTNNLVFRTNFSEADYISTAISANNLTVTGLALEYSGTSQLTARNSADFVEDTNNYEDGVNVSKETLTFESELSVVSEVQSYVFYAQATDLVMFEVDGDFEVKDPDTGDWTNEFFSEVAEEEVIIEVRFLASAVGPVTGTIIHTADGFDDVEIALNGTATEVLPTSIYDIQFTEDASGDSPLNNQDVIVEAIVSVSDFTGKYFLTSPEGGAWNGIYVYDSANTVADGDLIRIKAVVYEYNGFTELKTVSEFEILSSGNDVPAPVVISTLDLASNEAYESVMVTIENVTVETVVNSYGEWYVNDGTGACQIDNAMFTLDPPAELDAVYTSITGVIDFSYNNYGLNPRTELDVVEGAGVTELDAPVVLISITDGVITLNWEDIENANSYNIWMSDNPTVDTSSAPDFTVYTSEKSLDATDMKKFFQIKASTEGAPARK